MPRQILPLIYVLLIVVGFLISKPLGGAIAVIGALLLAIAYRATAPTDGPRAQARAERRARRRG